jgi:hypothetical protein
MYRGFPCPNKEVMESTQVLEVVEKLDKVIGSNSKAEAKIAGITPAVLTFKGK